MCDADEVKGYGYDDHLKIGNGPVLREMQSFESGLTVRANPVPRRAGMKGKEREKLSIRTSKPIPESEPEVDVAIVSAAVDGYESSGSSDPGSALPPTTPVPANRLYRPTLSAPLSTPAQCSPKRRSRRAWRLLRTRDTPRRCSTYFSHIAVSPYSTSCLKTPSVWKPPQFG